MNVSSVGSDQGRSHNKGIAVYFGPARNGVSSPKFFKNDYVGPIAGPASKLFPPPPVGLMRPSDTGPTLNMADGSSDVCFFSSKPSLGLQTASQTRRFVVIPGGYDYSASKGSKWLKFLYLAATKRDTSRRNRIFRRMSLNTQPHPITLISGIS
jgi:hypothetical protein